jgi:3-oxoacyl-[acyl-carrier-protein] synthase III
MPTGITALGSYAPERIMTNHDFEAMFETSDEWIVSRTGIRERHIAAEHEYASDMGVRAVRDLVARYPEALTGVDMVVCATSSPDALFPSTAAIIAGQVGLAGVGAMDVSVACSGFVYACATASGLIEAGVASKVLVLGAETLSKIIDWTDRGSCILFGDGGGAAIVERVPAGYGFQSFALGADSAGGPSLYKTCVADRLPGVPPELLNPTLGMNGREVFKFAVRVLGDSGQQALSKAGLSAGQVDWMIPHQANIRIIEAARERFGMPQDRVVVNLERYGNTSTASIPLALREALDGQQLLLVAFGGGLSWGASAMTWYAGPPEQVERARPASAYDSSMIGHTAVGSPAR